MEYGVNALISVPWRRSIILAEKQTTYFENLSFVMKWMRVENWFAKRFFIRWRWRQKCVSISILKINLFLLSLCANVADRLTAALETLPPLWNLMVWDSCKCTKYVTLQWNGKLVIYEGAAIQTSSPQESISTNSHLTLCSHSVTFDAVAQPKPKTIP